MSLSDVQIKPDHAYAPDFFIVGAPKCGTTALYSYLNDRTDIFMPEVKEPNFYADDLKVQTQVQTQDEYNALFHASKEGQMSGEASVWYLYSETALQNILDINPQAKFIVMIRNPLEMYPSLHAQLLYSLWEDVQDPEKAWHAQESRDEVPSFCLEPAVLDYKAVCALGAQLERFIKVVPENQRRIVLFDDFKANPAVVYRDIISFLELSEDGRTDFPVINDRKEHQSSGFAKSLRSMTRLLAPLKRVLRKVFPNMSSSVLKPLYDIGSKRSKRAELSDDFQNQILKEFEQDIQKIEKIIDRDLTHWRRK